MACEVPEMSCAIQGGRPHSKPPLVTASLIGRVGVHVGPAVVDVDVDDVDVDDVDVDDVDVVDVDVDVDVDVVDVEEEVLVVVVIVEIFGLQEQAEL